MKIGILASAFAGIVLLFVSAVPVSSMVSDNRKGPEVMNLKERFSVEGKKHAVEFPHAKHQLKLQCTECHKSPAGGKGTLHWGIEKKTGFANDFHKKICWPCHAKRNVPKGKSCKTCHK